MHRHSRWMSNGTSTEGWPSLRPWPTQSPDGTPGTALCAEEQVRAHSPIGQNHDRQRRTGCIRILTSPDHKASAGWGRSGHTRSRLPESPGADSARLPGHGDGAPPDPVGRQYPGTPARPSCGSNTCRSGDRRSYRRGKPSNRL